MVVSTQLERDGKGMQKIRICTTKTEYNVFSDENIIFTVSKSDLVLDGNKLYNNFFSKLDVTKKLDFNIEIDSSITDSIEKRIANDIQSVLLKIVDSINVKFNHTDEVMTENV